jgi:hypothetical protein
MTVLLVLLFISILIGIDELRQYVKSHKQEIYVHKWGLSMADGGKKVKK